jgi:hypothetical protein
MVITAIIWNGAEVCMNWIAYRRAVGRVLIGHPGMIRGVIRLIDLCIVKSNKKTFSFFAICKKEI